MSGTIENQVVPDISEEDEACIQAMLISTTPIFCWVLKAATDLDLFGIIAGAGPAACMTPTEIASQLPTQDSKAPSRLDRMLRLLASHSVLTCSIHTLEDGRVERLYGLTPASQFLFEKEDRGSVACISAFYSHRAVYEVRYGLSHCVLYKCKNGNGLDRMISTLDLSHVRFLIDPLHRSIGAMFFLGRIIFTKISFFRGKKCSNILL